MASVVGNGGGGGAVSDGGAGRSAWRSAMAVLATAVCGDGKETTERGERTLAAASRSRSKMGFRSQIVGLGHDGEAARPWLEHRPPALLVGRGADESGEGPIDPLPLHGADPDQQVARVEPMGRREGGVVVVVEGMELEALVEATAEGARVGGGIE